MSSQERPVREAKQPIGVLHGQERRASGADGEGNALVASSCGRRHFPLRVGSLSVGLCCDAGSGREATGVDPRSRLRVPRPAPRPAGEGALTRAGHSVRDEGEGRGGRGTGSDPNHTLRGSPRA